MLAISIGNKKVPIELLVTDNDIPTTGLVPLVAMRRMVDNVYFDFADEVFKISGHILRQAPMTELGLGRYQKYFDSSKSIFDETYVTFEFSSSGLVYKGIEDVYRFTSDTEILKRVGQTTCASAGYGPGGCKFVYTVRDKDTNKPIAGVLVFVTADANGPDIIAGPELTNAKGQITFNLVANTAYYFWRNKSGYTFTNPDREVVKF